MDRDYLAMYQRLESLMEELEGFPEVLEEAGELMGDLQDYYYSEDWLDDRDSADLADAPLYGEDEFAEKVDEALQYADDITYALDAFRSVIDTQIDDL